MLLRMRAVGCALGFSLVVATGNATAGTDMSQRDLQLEVVVNGRATHLIGAFAERSDGGLWITRREMSELGLDAPGAGSPDEWLNLAALAGVHYAYDERLQRVEISADPDRIKPYRLDLRGAIEALPTTPSELGALVNYTLYGSSSTTHDRSHSDRDWSIDGAAAQLEARVFGPHGQLSQTGIVSAANVDARSLLRLDTTYVYADRDAAVTYRTGDVITRGPAWARAVRLGGAQAERNFGLRPDLVTAPLPGLRGSAAVPSTVDVLIDNVRTYTGEVPAGRYELSNLPTLSGSGTAQVVLRDASGREVATNLPFFTSASLLRQGLLDFAAQIGVPRLSYGAESFDYRLQPVATGGVRYGVTDWLTVETYGEGGADTLNGGAGFSVDLAGRAVISAAARGSTGRGNHGFLGYASVETLLWGVTLSASTQRTFGAFDDLASSLARAAVAIEAHARRSVSGYDALGLITPGLPRVLDRVSIGVPLNALGGTVGIGLINRIADGSNGSSRLLTASYGMSLWGGASLSATLFADLERKRGGGAFAAFSTPLGFGDARASAGTTLSQAGRLQGTLEASRAPGFEAGSYGWRARVIQGEEGGGSVGGTYRSQVARLDGQLDQIGEATRGRIEAEGALVLMRGGAYATNRVGEAFAIADVGAPDIDVSHQNRRIGRTDASGRILVPDLVPGQRNRIAIDPMGLPVDADITATTQIVVPAEGGVMVPFGVAAKTIGVRLVLNDAEGQPLRPGLRGRVSGSDETFSVGYDGQTYLRDLPRGAALMVDRPEGGCTASVPEAVGIGLRSSQPLVCR